MQTLVLCLLCSVLVCSVMGTTTEHVICSRQLTLAIALEPFLKRQLLREQTEVLSHNTTLVCEYTTVPHYYWHVEDFDFK